jgi:hypothetical protein
MVQRGDHGFPMGTLIVVVYAVGVLIWALQPGWLTRQPLLPGVLITLVVSGLFGLLSGQWRSLAAPLLFGLMIGAISAATVDGDLGRAGEFVVATVWGLALATAMAAGIWIRRGIR